MSGLELILLIVGVLWLFGRGCLMTLARECGEYRRRPEPARGEVAPSADVPSAAVLSIDLQG